jgi:integrase
MAKTESNLLNDVALRQVIRAGQPCAKSDGGGLTFTLSSAGTAAWVLRFRHGGRRHELTLGRYPDLTLQAARRLAATHRVKVQSGTNPVIAIRAAKTRKDWSVRQLVEDYRTMVLPSMAKSTQTSYGRNLKRVATGMGAISVSDVSAADVIAQIERVKVGYVERFTLWVVLNAIFKHATGKKMLERNPCAGINLSSIIGKRPEIRKRLMLEAAELTVLLNANMSLQNRLSMALLLATGVRVSELYSAKWCDIYLDEGRWHIPQSKKGLPIDIPLVPVVIDWFKELKAQAEQSLAGESGYVLPARKHTRIRTTGGDTHINPNVIGSAIVYWIEHHKPAIRQFTPHDLRSTMKSYLRKLGVARDISEMCLNHKLAGVEGVYDQYAYWDERRDALGRWANFLVTCKNASSNVVLGRFGT